MRGPRQALLLVAVAALGMGRVHAQTRVFSGAGRASAGSGTRSVLFVDGTYFVFFDSGSEVVYATSLDGTSFSAPRSASGAPANLGFSVARRNASTLGLVWGSSGGGGYELWYREATVAGATRSHD